MAMIMTIRDGDGEPRWQWRYAMAMANRDGNGDGGSEGNFETIAMRMPMQLQVQRNAGADDAGTALVLAQWCCCDAEADAVRAYNSPESFRNFGAMRHTRAVTLADPSCRSVDADN